jgi:hypothetical protein
MAAIREALVPMDNDHRNEDAFTRVESPEIRLEQGPINRIVTPVSESVGLICGVGMLAMVLMMSYEVIARYVFNAPTSWVTEYSCMCSLLQVSLGQPTHNSRILISALRSFSTPSSPCADISSNWFPPGWGSFSRSSRPVRWVLSCGPSM